jgi:flagellar biosynthetic protein FlhB
MADDSSQERTELPTPKRLEDARKRGQVPRSTELQTFLLLLVASAALAFTGSNMVSGIKLALQSSLGYEQPNLLISEELPVLLASSFAAMFEPVLPFILTLIVTVLAGSGLLGGWVFSSDLIRPKLERINPLKGLARIFSSRGVVELLKALAKFAVVAAVMALLVYSLVQELSQLPGLGIDNGLARGAAMMLDIFLYLSLTLIAVVVLDVPYQLWKHRNELMMTRQEVRDEIKQSEGKPEVKAAIRARQREFAQRKMLQAIQTADVIITNPTHYAVALKYDATKARAPVLVAKGRDLIAATIREKAQEFSVPLFSAPPLARAIYFSTEIDRQIPEKLFVAVAQVLAYVYQLRKSSPAERSSIPQPKDLPVPPDLDPESER